MSVRVMGWVWENSRQQGGHLLVLLALADFAHDDGGGAHPSVKTLATKARLSERQTQYAIRDLESDGEIMVERGTGLKGVNNYAVLMATPSLFKGEGAEIARVQKLQGAVSRNGGVQPIAPKPLSGEPEEGNPPSPSEMSPPTLWPESSKPEPKPDTLTPPSPPRPRKPEPRPMTSEEREKLYEMVGDVWTREEVDERIEEILGHAARDKNKTEYLYTRRWLREDAAKERRFRQSRIGASTNGRPRDGPIHGYATNEDYLESLRRGAAAYDDDS